MRVPRFTGIPPFSRRARYSETEDQSHSIPNSSSRLRAKLLPSSVTGAVELPQFPAISVVTPWRILLSALGLMMNDVSVWVCTSTNPGETSSPLASITFLASYFPSAPAFAILSPSTATSPRNQGFPEPSTILPPLITTV